MLRITGPLHGDLRTCMISRWIFFRMRNVSGKSCRAHQNTHFMSSNFFSEDCALYEMWKNTVEPERSQVTIYYGWRIYLRAGAQTGDSFQTVFRVWKTWVYWHHISEYSTDVLASSISWRPGQPPSWLAPRLVLVGRDDVQSGRNLPAFGGAGI